jgi:polyisoprenoid-binding protein YceI
MARLPGRRTKRVAMFVIGGVVVVVVALFLVVYFVIFPTSSPKPFSLKPSTATGATGSTAQSTERISSGKLGGHWTVAAGSQAGYRVREKLAELPAESDAVGRTSEITGNATFTELGHAVTITAASFTVAVSTLKSDRSMRDERIHEIGLESSRYPNATFVLTRAIAVPASAIKGNVARVPLTGIFNIHGVAKQETLPAEVSLSGATFEAVGSLTFPWSEFGMTAPSVGGFVDVTETATMEFDIHLAHA